MPWLGQWPDHEHLSFAALQLRSAPAAAAARPSPARRRLALRAGGPAAGESPLDVDEELLRALRPLLGAVCREMAAHLGQRCEDAGTSLAVQQRPASWFERPSSLALTTERSRRTRANTLTNTMHIAPLLQGAPGWPSARWQRPRPTVPSPR